MDLLEYVNKVQALIKSGADKLVSSWREEAPGKSDDEILRLKLMECGWKYRRAGRNPGWYHPQAPNYPAPRTLKDMADLLSEFVIKERIAQ